jgi:hypothetical protein
MNRVELKSLAVPSTRLHTIGNVKELRKESVLTNHTRIVKKPQNKITEANTHTRTHARGSLHYITNVNDNCLVI